MGYIYINQDLLLSDELLIVTAPIFIHTKKDIYIYIYIIAYSIYSTPYRHKYMINMLRIKYVVTFI